MLKDFKQVATVRLPSVQHTPYCLRVHGINECTVLLNLDKDAFLKVLTFTYVEQRRGRSVGHARVQNENGALQMFLIHKFLI